MDKRKIESLNIMIKPASSNCNLRCRYCFYFDEANNRKISDYGMMKIDTLEKLIQNVFSNVTKSASFLFQGGEPTLRGVEFFYEFHRLIDYYNKDNINVGFAIQTNGALIDDNWLNLFEKYNYLVGISLDGIKSSNEFRINQNGDNVFDKVIENLDELKKRNIDFNILTVINSKVARSAKEIYNFYKENDIYFMQFIPLIDSFDNKRKDYSLSEKDYGVFLDELFNLWYEDIIKKDIRSIRYFENLIMILMGRNPESCDMTGHCSINLIVEADGSVYPCDFYVIDRWKLGNIKDKSIIDILFSKKSYEFIKRSSELNNKCKNCKYLKICRSGCYRYKDNRGYNKFCESYKYFYERNLEKLFEIRDLIINQMNEKA